jgi:hypothetical protein
MKSIEEIKRIAGNLENILQEGIEKGLNDEAFIKMRNELIKEFPLNSQIENHDLILWIKKNKSNKDFSIDSIVEKINRIENKI